MLEVQGSNKNKENFFGGKTCPFNRFHHAQGEGNVDETAANFPTKFRKPFTQITEGQLKSFFHFILEKFLWTCEVQILLLFRSLFFEKPDKVFPNLRKWLNTEETSSEREFSSEGSRGLVDCSFDNPIEKLWPKNRIVFSQNPKSKNTSEFLLVWNWS